MNKKLKTEAVDHLFQAILTLKNTDECYSFFEDVCTVNELLSFSQRYEDAAREEDISGDRGQDRRIDSDDQPCQPFFKLRKRRI